MKKIEAMMPRQSIMTPELRAHLGKPAGPTIEFYDIPVQPRPTQPAPEVSLNSCLSSGEELGYMPDGEHCPIPLDWTDDLPSISTLF